MKYLYLTEKPGIIFLDNCAWLYMKAGRKNELAFQKGICVYSSQLQEECMIIITVQVPIWSAFSIIFRPEDFMNTCSVHWITSWLTSSLTTWYLDASYLFAEEELTSARESQHYYIGVWTKVACHFLACMKQYRSHSFTDQWPPMYVLLTSGLQCTLMHLNHHNAYPIQQSIHTCVYWIEDPLWPWIKPHTHWIATCTFTWLQGFDTVQLTDSTPHILQIQYCDGSVIYSVASLPPCPMRLVWNCQDHWPQLIDWLSTYATGRSMDTSMVMNWKMDTHHTM